MKKIIVLNDIKDDNLFYIQTEVETFDYSINIPIEYTDSLENIKNRNQEYKSAVSEYKEIIEDFSINRIKNDAKVIKEIEKKPLIRIFDESEYIKIKLSTKKLINFVNENKEILEKKIVPKKIYDYSEKSIKEVEILQESIPNLYLEVKNNFGLVEATEYLKGTKIIRNIVNNIKKLTDSPLEQSMLIYDLVRNKKYKKEEKVTEEYDSRSTIKSLLYENRVCLGYANIFSSICNELNIRNKIIYLKTEDSGHARNILYINDKKYGIEGAYYFDTTWDSKKSENDKTYLSSYKYFAKTKEEIENYSNYSLKKEDLNTYIENYSYFNETFDIDFEEAIDEKGIDNVPTEILRTINCMSLLIRGKFVFDPVKLYLRKFDNINIDNLKEITSYLTYCFSNSIPGEKFIKLFYNVRKLEYYINNEKYQLSIEDIVKTSLQSDWKFSGTAKENLFLFFNIQLSEETRKRQINDYLSKTDTEKQIEQVKVAKVLRRVLEKENK